MSHTKQQKNSIIFNHSDCFFQKRVSSRRGVVIINERENKTGQKIPMSSMQINALRSCIQQAPKFVFFQVFNALCHSRRLLIFALPSHQILYHHPSPLLSYLFVSANDAVSANRQPILRRQNLSATFRSVASSSSKTLH